MTKAVLLAVLASACTTLGPMPATTGISAVPAGRPEIEAQAAVMPAYFLSQSAQDQPGAAPIPQASVLVEPDKWLGIPGLIAGARVYGGDPDNAVELYVGLRRTVDADEDVSIAAIAYGTSQHSGQTHASYRADRFGGELALDLRWWKPFPWLSARTSRARSRRRRSTRRGRTASGPTARRSTARTTGPITSSRARSTACSRRRPARIALDIGRSKTHLFNGARIALMMATGRMPLLVDGTQSGTGVYYEAGMSITLGFGGH